MVVLGIDPGSRLTGWGVVRLAGPGARVEAVAHGTIAGHGASLPERLVALGRGLEEVLDRHRPALVGVEQAFYSKNGGNLGETNSVGWMFEPRGVIEVERAGRSDDTILDAAIEAGADDVEFGAGETATVTTAPSAFDAVKKALLAAGYTIASSELSKVATTTVELDEKAAASTLRLFELLESHDDVQKVHANFQIADEVMQKLAQ